jgi:hypothetical protein
MVYCPRNKTFLLKAVDGGRIVAYVKGMILTGENDG